MKGFEAAFKFLDGFNFADAGSRENALWARIWALEGDEGMSGSSRPPLVVITCPVLSEARELARRLCAYTHHACSNSTADDAILNALNSGVNVGLQVLHFELLTPELRSASLEAFVTSSTWTCRQLGDMQSEKVDLRTLVIISAESVGLSRDLHRRAVFIRLAPRAADEALPQGGELLAMDAKRAAAHLLENCGAIDEHDLKLLVSNAFQRIRTLEEVVFAKALAGNGAL